jgi:hypothetical protein
MGGVGFFTPFPNTPWGENLEGTPAATPPPSFQPFEGFPREPDFSNILGDTFDLFIKHWPLFFIPYFVWGALSTVATLVLMGAVGIPLFDPTGGPIRPLTREALVALILLLVVLGIATLLVTSLLIGGITHLAVELYRGRKATLRSALMKGVERLPSILGAVVLQVLIFVGIILLFLLPSFGLALVTRAPGFALVIILLALAVAVIIAIYVYVALSLFAPAIMVEGMKAVEGLERSWDVTRNRRASLFAVYLVLGLLQSAGQAVGSIPSPDPLTGVALLAVQVVVAGIVGSWFVIAAAVAYELIVSPIRSTYDRPLFGLSQQPGGSPPPDQPTP